MIKPEVRPFQWDEKESATQDEACMSITSLGDEYNINVLYISGTCFVSLCEMHNIASSAFTVEQFNKWKDTVADRMIEFQNKVEMDEFSNLLKELNKNGK